MRVLIYNKNTNKGQFTNYGYGKLTFIHSCKVTEELNGRYEAEVICSLSDSKLKYLTKWAILSINGQLFRIYNTVTNDRDFTMKVHARHIFYDLDFGFIEDKKADSKTMKEALSIAIPDGFQKFTPNSDIETKKNIYYVKDGGVQAIFRTLERWGVGELIRDNFNYSINYSKGKDNGVTFTYKKVEAIEVTEDLDNIVTRLYPTGKEGITLKEKYIIIPNWSEENYLPYHITKEVKFEAENEGDLRVLATNEAKVMGLGRTNFKINVSDLVNTELYKDMPSLMSVEVGDIVTIKHSSLDIRVKVKVIKKETDYATKQVIIELGQPLDDFFKSVDNSRVQVDIPNLDNYRDGLFYYSNGIDTIYRNGVTPMCSLGFSVNAYSNLMLYFNAFAFCDEDCTAKILVYRDNEKLDLEPTVDLQKGNRIISFTYPLMAISEGTRHQIDIKLDVSKGGVITLLKGQLQVMVKGQGISGGGAERPHAEIIEKIDLSKTHTHNLDINDNVYISFIKPSILKFNESIDVEDVRFTSIDVNAKIEVTTDLYIEED